MKKTIWPRLLFGGFSLIALASPAAALAHCPLCTAGAGLVALGAYKLGVSGLTVGLLIGAFAVALGLWLGKIITKKYLPGQNNIITVFSWLTTVLPLQTLLSDYTSIYISWSGDYGSWLNRTYPINLFLVGGILGAIIVYQASPLSKFIAKRRGKNMPFQTMAVTFALLLLASLITQFIF
ncbi:MAG: hypothetical protein Q8O93_02330 [bacterium]|nr:hypothetical protein [bacterium]